MYEMFKDVACVITALISFLYGTRVAWGFGRKSPFREHKDHRIQFLFESIPSAAILYFIGFMVVFSYVVSGFITMLVFSLTSSILCALLVVATSMPELKSKGSGEGIVAELYDGSVGRLSRDAFNHYLSEGKIKKFRRGTGWVVVGKDPMREDVDGSIYVGVERRAGG